ncbi:MAG: WYL domain-containing protein [Christensenella sp.]
MSSKSTSTERQLFILSLLSQRKSGYTINEITDSLNRMADIEASRRMVARDMDYISQNFFVYEEEQNGKLVYKADKYALSDMDFSMAEVVSLYFTEQVLETYETLGMAKDALKIVRRIRAKLPELSRSAMTSVEKMIKIVPDGTLEVETDEDILETVQEALQTSHSLKLKYHSFASDETLVRVFDPYVLEVREGCWHMIGHCHLRNAVRDLRVSRITDAEVTDKTFSVPGRFYEEYRKTRFDKLAGAEAEEIAVRFSGEAAKLVREYHAHKADSLTEEKDGVLFCKKAAITPDLKSWLLSFGAQAEIISPARLKAELKDEVLRMYQMYKDNNQKSVTHEKTACKKQ